MAMAWNGSREEEEERGLELSLGLPGYFAGSQGQAGVGNGSGGLVGAATGAKGCNGFRSSRPAAAALVIGWPPLRSFRRNLASSSSKPPFTAPNQGKRPGGDDMAGTSYRGMFVKVNMDGVPIGRKVDLKAQGSYGTLIAAVDQLFQGLVAARRDPAIAAAGQSCSGDEHNAMTGLLDGSGEYTLVYEDDEGDQMLVGDVPWGMFISTAKRLRVLRSSELNSSSLRAAVSRKRAAAEC